MLQFIAQIDPSPVGIGVLATGLLLGLRHGIDWDHIAAITDITSSTAAATAAQAAHADEHRTDEAHQHGHGGATELQVHGPSATSAVPRTNAALQGVEATSVAGATLASATMTGVIAGTPVPRARATVRRRRFGKEQVEAIRLGTLYAVGHGLVVIALGLAAIAFGALLPDWLDPIMGRIVGLTLVGLGLWVLYSVYRYARGGGSFRLRSRWMLEIGRAHV